MQAVLDAVALGAHLDQAQHLVLISGALESYFIEEGQYTGFRVLRQFIGHSWDLDLLMRIQIWRSHLIRSNAASHSVAVASLEARMQTQGQGAALRQLMQIMVRLMKGEVAMRLEVWRQGVKEGAYLAYVEVEAQMKAQSQMRGLKRLLFSLRALALVPPSYPRLLQMPLPLPTTRP